VATQAGAAGEAAESAATAAKGSTSVSPAFWQLLLSAELPFLRREALLARARRMPQNTDWRAFFDEAPEMSQADRARLARVKPDLAASALQQGAQLIEKDMLPERFRALPGVAPALFIAGDPSCLDAPTVGIVGTRGASTYGKAAARKFAEAFVRAGVTVVSGGAQGVDAAAHEGALEAGGKTACVLACGIDRVYPVAHRNLFQRVRGQGCLISQFPAGWNPRSDSFVQRNATVAALSQALLVIEAPAQSGSLITANRANEYGRQVFVVPGSISSLSFRGSHALIRDGATLADHPDQILEDLGIRPGLRLSADEAETQVRRRILAAIGADPLDADRIAEGCGMDSADVLSELTMLELEGKVLRSPGGYILAP
jgi:DNA processing protein